MTKYIIKNIIHSFTILLGVITITFVFMYILPGDPAKFILGQRTDEQSVEAVKKELGLDKPIYFQYADYITNVIKGDLGKSYITNRSVSNTLLEKIPATFILSFTAMFLSAVFGICAGVLSAVKKQTLIDSMAMFVSLFGISIPQFVLGLFIVFIFASQINLLPASGYLTEGPEYIILPALTLSLRPMAIIARMTRSSMIDELSKEYIRTAESKGLSKITIIFKHALRNALNPVVTTMSSSLAATLGGVFFIEYIFNWPGIGLLAIESIMKLDYPMLQGTVLFTAVVFVFVNFFVDILYAFLDPKVKINIP